MKYLILLFFLACTSNAQEEFPADFLFGAATASYQIEGAYDEEGKGENIWDRITTTNPAYIDNNDNGNVACDAYHHTDGDVQLLSDLGVSVYRFSISWSRILPTGHANKINQFGIDYYSDLIDKLIAANIQPVVTMYHWDLPQPLQEIGGWTNPLLADYFEAYAEVLFQQFGSRVNYWITFNEPYEFCTGGYSTYEQAPGYTQDGIGGYLCGHTVLLAHARVYHLYKNQYLTENPTGQIGITLDTEWFSPADETSTADQTAALTSLQFKLGWFANPIFSELGDYPDIMKANIQEISNAIGYNTDRLPTFTAVEIASLLGSSDFFGLNHYTTRECTTLDEVPTTPSHEADTKASCISSPNWAGSASSWLKVAPWGFGELLRWISANYGAATPILITENGFSDATGELQDCDRAYYFNAYLEVLLKARTDGVNVIGYHAWSFLDNFEWRRGYTERFGLYHVDFTNDERTRTPKMSSLIYKNIIETRQVNWDYIPPGYETGCDWVNSLFPYDFKFGVATASYQIEGAWNEDGKGENIWDYITHTFPEKILDASTGDIACDAYHKTAEDVALLKSMGVDFYRFSISWSRILPTGHDNNINAAGIAYYSNLIDQLIANDITPVVTIFHWDLPQPMQELGGWPNSLIADYFVDYANVLFANFGGRVKDWITFNEPYQICQNGYSDGLLAPAYENDGIAGYLCSYTLLTAHARTYQLYDETYREAQGGRVGITINALWKEPADEDSPEDIAAAETAMQFVFGWYANPIFSTTGDWPTVMKENIDALSASEGFIDSRLPEFTEEEITLIRGSADFLGLNYYTTDLCRPLVTEDGAVSPSHQLDSGAFCYQDENWEESASTWLKVEPTGLRKTLVWIRDAYNNPEVFITENGFSDSTGLLEDCRRINYYNTYLQQLLLAINEDGCNVSGYTAWSFMDNFEWMRGYTERFGLNHVNYDSADLTRTPKMSSYIYQNIMKYRKIDWDFVPVGFEACDWDTNEV